MDPTPVDRCVCCHVWFADIVRESRETRAGFDALQEKLGFGRGCGMCVPYVRVALETGRSRLPVMRVPDHEKGPRPG